MVFFLCVFHEPSTVQGSKVIFQEKTTVATELWSSRTLHYLFMSSMEGTISIGYLSTVNKASISEL